MKTKSYTITAEKLEAASAALFAQEGILIRPDTTSGSVAVHNVRLSYVRSDAVLTVTIESKPFYVPESAIWEPPDKVFA